MDDPVRSGGGRHAGGVGARGTAAQALATLLVRECVTHRQPPPDVPAVAAAREELRADHLGDVGRWLETAIVADDQHRLSTDALWEAALKTTGEQPGTDKAWGVGRHQIVDLVKQLHPKLPALKKMRVDGKVRYGWEHWRLATAEEAEEAARPEPVQSGLAADISNSDGDSIRLVAGTDADPVFELREGWTARELIEQFRARGWHAPKPESTDGLGCAGCRARNGRFGGCGSGWWRWQGATVAVRACGQEETAVGRRSQACWRQAVERSARPSGVRSGAGSPAAGRGRR